MLYIAWMVILGGHIIKNLIFRKLDFELPRVQKLHKRIAYKSMGIPTHTTPHIPPKVKTT